MARRPSSRHRRDVDQCISTQAPAAKKKPTPLTDEELNAVYEAYLDSDTSKATARVIQRMAETRLGLERDSLKPKKAEIRRFMQELMYYLEARTT